MKFIGISLILHTLLLVGLFIESNIHVHDKGLTTIELLMLPSKISQRASTPSRQKIMKSKKRIKKQKTLATNKIKDSFIEEESSSSEQESQKLNYTQELNLFLVKNKKYPRRALKLRQSGTVQVRVIISPQGFFKDIEVINPSSYKILNQAAKKLLTKLRRFKPLPKGYNGNGEFIIPVSYQLKASQTL